MGLLGDKKPLYEDWDKGIRGTWVEFDDTVSDSDKVHVWYVPFGITTKKVRTDTPVLKKDIHKVTPTGHAPGTEQEIFVVYSGGEESLVDFMDTKNMDELRNLREKVKDMEIENATLRNKLESLQSGVDEEVARARKTAGARDRVTDFGDFRREKWEENL